MKNQGIELSAQVEILKSDDFNIVIGGNVTAQNSKITELIPGASSYGLATGDGINGGVGNQVQVNQVGYAPNSFLVYEQAYGTDGKPIDGVFVDRNGDGSIGLEDKYVFHKPSADFYYGFFTNFNYKNWDLSTAWRGSWGNYVYNNVDSALGWENQVLIRNTDLSNGVSNLLDTNFSYNGIERYLSDYYVQKASFLKLDNITIGYNFNKFFGVKADTKLSLGVQNVLIITDYKGIDPEISNGIDKTIYPRPRMFTLGLNVNF